MPDMNISLPPEAMAVITKAVEGGKFTSGSEVVAEALRAWSENQIPTLGEQEPPFTVRSMEELRAKWEEAIADPHPGTPMEEVFSKLEAKYLAMEKERHRCG